MLETNDPAHRRDFSFLQQRSSSIAYENAWIETLRAFKDQGLINAQLGVSTSELTQIYTRHLSRAAWPLYMGCISLADRIGYRGPIFTNCVGEKHDEDRYLKDKNPTRRPCGCPR